MSHPTIHINSFVRRQTEGSPFSHWTIGDEELVARIGRNLHQAKPGYREGVVLVPVEPDGFFSGVVPIRPDDVLVGKYAARRPGEDPRRHVYAVRGQKLRARQVDIVLYGHAVLALGNENESQADWEVVSVNANPEEGEMPIQPGTLTANHLRESGGTGTGMTDSEFVAALRISRDYWKDKAMLADATTLEEVRKAIDSRNQQKDLRP